MLYILVGKDSFFIKEKIKEISKNNYHLISLKKDKDYLIQIDNLINKRLFDHNPHIVLIDVDKIEMNDYLISKFKIGNFILVFSAKSQIFIKKIKSLSIPYQIIEIEKTNFKNERAFYYHLKNYLKNKNIELSDRIIFSLVKIFLNNHALLFNELKKIEFTKLNQEEFLDIIRWPNESTIFFLTNDLIEKNYSDFILRLKRELHLGSSFNNILSLIYKTLIRIYLLKNVKNLKQENLLGLKPYYKEILKKQANKISEGEILKLIKFISEIDRKYKKFLIDENQAVYLLAEFLKLK
ncbi:MAG: hypothetical protein KatS3mg094_476 [Candidatus Parcubacteria bacterium]|nr:MAG: hypothetical protein KatS3mg094_476 [Candidatus Parcubacteria bacterium]